MAIREQGWECPKCARIWAPKIAACGACNDRGTLNYVPLRPVARTEHTAWNWTADDPSWTG